jgi:hypothetical protein
MPKMLSMAVKACMAVLCMLVFSSTSRAGDEYIYANNFDGGTDYIWRIDITTGGTVTEYAVPVSTVGGYNGRGVVDVNNTLYLTTSSSGGVFAYNLTTSSLTTAFTVAGASGLSSITYTGTDFIIGDYSGTNKVYFYNATSGLLDKTITLANCTGYCDGLTYIIQGGVGEILSNRADGYNQLSLYDLYDTNGTLLKSAFIDTTNLSTLSGGKCNDTTGIAWDGTNFFVSCLYDAQLAEYGATGNFIGFVNLDTSGTTNNGGVGPGMEGLSANFAVTIPPSVPEPASLSLLAFGLAGLGLFRRKKTA